MDFHEDFPPMFLVFLIVFGIATGVLLAFAFQINVWWALSLTELGESLTRDTISIRTQWEIFFQSIPLNLLFCIPLAVGIGIGITALISD